MRDTSFSFLFHSILLCSLLFPHFSETVSLFFRLPGQAVPKQLTRWGHEARRSHRALKCDAWAVDRAVRWNPMEGRKQEHSHRHSHAPVVYKEAPPVLYMPHTQYIVTSHRTGSLSGSCVLPRHSRRSTLSIFDSQ